jgi:hypothetical protein
MNYVNERYAQLYGQKGSYFNKDVAIKIVPAPVGGWDAISPLAVMDPKYANALTNWTPRTGWVEIRGGYNPWAQGISTSPVNTLMCYRQPLSGIETLFASTGSVIWNVSTYGVPTSSLTGRVSDKNQFVNFTPSLGGVSYLVVANGSDSVVEWNGTAWSTPAITGVVSSTLMNPTAFKQRLFFTQINSTQVWYLGVSAITGAATAFDLGPFMTKGGYVVAMADWTVGGGQGPQDYMVFITSKGQCIVYQGTDITNANAWALVGVFDLPPPIGTRCYCKLGQDVLIITTQGLIPLSQVLPFDPSAARSVAITNRIQNAMLLATMGTTNNFGWQVIPFAAQALLFMNVPQLQSSVQVQYVMNTLTGAWTQYTGWNANCFEIYNESLYFGDNSGNVNLAYAGGLDKNNAILADMRCAFNYLDEPGRLKAGRMIRPFLVADGQLTPTISIDADFSTSSPSAPVTILTPTGALWDTGLWDTALWSTGSGPVTNWQSCLALGTALSIHMVVNLQGGGVSSVVTSSSVFDTGVFDTMVFDGNGVTTMSGVGVPVLQVNVFELSLEYGAPI